MKKTISQFVSLGLSEYEAKAYLALLKDYPCTAYELAKSSGIPTSKIYEVIKKLLVNGLVNVIADNNKQRYIPIGLNDFINKQKNKLEVSLKNIERSLSDFLHGSEDLTTWNIIDYDFLIEKTRTLIDKATHTLLISIWKDEFLRLEDPIRNAEKRGVRVAILHFGNAGMKIGKIYQHPVEESVFKEKKGRCLTVVSDSKEALTGTILKFGNVEGAWSKNRGFITIAEEFIKHDIYIMKIVRRFDNQLQSKFGSKYEKLRDIFSDEEVI